ncbi:MAG: DUF4097 family beta strand repeat-containing protein [Tissierellia bacterium]|nr:DUF4097 family beta strand repeat-containing protein [Tissierellia bacterium]
MSRLFKIAIILLIIGLVLVGLSYYLGLRELSLPIRPEERAYEEKVKEFDNLRELEIDFKSMSIEIVSSKEEKNQLIYPHFERERDELVIREDGGLLRIEQKEKGHDLLFENPKPLFIKLYLEENSILEKLHIESAYGQVNTKGIKVKSGAIKLNVGGFRSENDQFEDFEISTNIGQIDLENTSFINAKLESNLGEIKGSLIPKGDLIFKTRLGGIQLETLGGIKYAYQINANMGQASFNGREVKSGDLQRRDYRETMLRISTDMGQASIVEK